MLAYFLYGLFFISCLVLIATVLLQPGKTDAGALFTSNISSTAFGPRGTQSVLSRITITAAAIFMLSALLLALPAITGNVSVLQTTSESSTTAPANTATNAEANSSASGNVTNTAVNTTAVNNSATVNANSNTNVNK
ncbi:MAG: preprotein translocase subunit SecG [Acidobacteriota bacterium]